MSHPEHDEHQFSPLAKLILDGLAEQYREPGDLRMVNETCVDVAGAFDVEELATYINHKLVVPSAVRMQDVKVAGAISISNVKAGPW